MGTEHGMTPEEAAEAQHVLDHINAGGIPPGALAELDQAQQAAWDWMIGGIQDLLKAEILNRTGSKTEAEQLTMRRMLNLRDLPCNSVRLATDLLLQLLVARMIEEWGGYREALTAFNDENAPLFPADAYMMPTELAVNLAGVAKLHLSALRDGPDPQLASFEVATWLEKRLIPALTHAYERDTV